MRKSSLIEPPENLPGKPCPLFSDSGLSDKLARQPALHTVACGRTPPPSIGSPSPSSSVGRSITIAALGPVCTRSEVDKSTRDTYSLMNPFQTTPLPFRVARWAAFSQPEGELQGSHKQDRSQVAAGAGGHRHSSPSGIPSLRGNRQQRRTMGTTPMWVLRTSRALPTGRSVMQHPAGSAGYPRGMLWLLQEFHRVPSPEIEGRRLLPRLATVRLAAVGGHGGRAARVPVAVRPVRFTPRHDPGLRLSRWRHA